MDFVEYCISKAYEPFRKVWNPSKKQWEYIPDTNTSYFSSSAPGYVDIRLIREGYREIVYGIPCVYTPENGNASKTHHPSLIYPNPFGDVFETDRAFEELSFEEILNRIENIVEDSVEEEI